MLPRRLLPGVLLSAIAAPALAAPADLGFRVLREGREVGTHRVRFRDEAGLLKVTSELRIQVRLAGFTVFRFTQDTEETWRGERLVALASRHDRNGRAGACTAEAEGAGLRLRGAAGEVVLPAAAVPLTWWRAASLGGAPLFEVREGRPVAPRIERRPGPAGLVVRVVGAETTEVAYDAAGSWSAFATTGDDGSPVRYERA
jgi:hypothetical protein